MTWPPSILSVLVWSPAVGAVFSACLRENRQRRRAAIGFAALTLAIAGALALTFEAATGPGRLNAVIVSADPKTGRATAIERLNLSAQEVDTLAAATTVNGLRA